MELVPWRPFGELSSFLRERENLWNRLFGEMPFPRLITEEWVPSVDILETKDKVLIKAELPGMESKDVHVSISGDLLTIKGEKKKDQEDKDEHHFRAERYYGSFQRVFQLPSSVQSDKVEATFEKGILKIILPKLEQAKKKQIEIKVK